MSKIAIACPFTHGVCMECPVYRGRHYYHCFARSVGGPEWEKLKETYVEIRKSNENHDETFGMPSEMKLNPSVISNVEDIIESEELSRLKERREG